MVGARVVGTQSGAGGYSPVVRQPLRSRRRATRVREGGVAGAESRVARHVAQRDRRHATSAARGTRATASARLRRRRLDRRCVRARRRATCRADRGTSDEAAAVFARRRGSSARFRSRSRRVPCRRRRIAWRRHSAVGRHLANTAVARARRLVSAHLDDLVALEVGLVRRGARGCARPSRRPERQHPRSSRPGAWCSSTGQHACIGARWLDLLVMIPSMVLEGAGEPEELADRSGLDAPRTRSTRSSPPWPAPLTWAASRPDPPGLPTVRAFQRAQGEVALRWLRTRLGDPVPQ